MLVILPKDYPPSFRKVGEYVVDEWDHLLLSGFITLITKNPLVGLVVHVGHHLWEEYGPGFDLIRGEQEESSGIGAPAGSTPTAPSTSPQDSRQGRESSEPGKHGVSRQSSQRRDRARRKSCPKGHYWSYKERKCVKSKF